MRFLIDELHAALRDVSGQQLGPQDWAPTPNRTLGDIAIPCFKLAKALGKAPPAVAQELAAPVEAKLKGGFVKGVKAVGPYLNVFFDGEKMHQRFSARAAADAGRTTEGQGRTIVIDFSSPNMAKEMGLHHLRSTAIGAALANIAEIRGYRVVRLNYLGDWGTAHGKNICALQRLGSEAELARQGLPYILDLYVQYNNLIKEETAAGSTAAADAAKAAFKKLEDGDAECRRLWGLLREVSIREAKLIYDRLGIRFDHYDGEALYETKLQGVVDEITATLGTRVSDGALVCDLPGKELPVLLQKDDGASLYMTRDLAAAADRFARFHYDRSWYVVAIQQKLHFEQLFTLIELLKKPYAGRCEHIPFGMLSFGNKTMKSREGNILFLKDVLDEAHSRAAAIIREKNPDLPNADDVAEMVGQAAILFTDLSQNRGKDIRFEWERALSFEGDTGPFVQYTHARCASLLEKGRAHLATLSGGDAARDLLDSDPSVRQLLGDLAYFETYVERAFNERDPSQVATSALEVAKSFNQLYHRIRFLEERSAPRLRALLELTEATRAVLAQALGLLGIRAPSAM